MTNLKCAGRIVIHYTGTSRKIAKDELAMIYDFVTNNVDWSKCPVPVTDVSKGYVTFEKPGDQQDMHNPEEAPTE